MSTKKREILTDEQVLQEIEQLNNSYYVKLARREQRIKYRARQKLYTMRWLERHGLELAEKGVTMETLDAMEVEDEPFTEEGGAQ